MGSLCIFIGIYLAVIMSLVCFGDGVWYDDCLDGFCEETPPCPDEVGQRQWNVANSSRVQTLAEAIRCSGGIFEVAWNGNIAINETFFVTNGAVLNVYGSGPDAVIDGDGNSRIFTVVNASLYLSNIRLANGNATSGGAIAASSSTLSFRQTTFYGNTASSNGGALLVSNSSNATFDENVIFWENTAGENGGGLYVSGGSVSSWLGNATFSNNIAANGGAICAAGGSNISLRGDTEFYRNVANSGVGEGGGGAIFVGDGAEVEWGGKINFTSNRAFWDGGAVGAKTAFGLAESWSSTSPVSRILMRGHTFFFNNTCGGNGGGMSLRAVSSVSFDAVEVFFSGNSADLAGGAIFISEISSGPFLSGVGFEDNSAQVGGAVYTFESQSTMTIDGCSFVGNDASSSGGAVENAGRVNFFNTSFIGNTAVIGGALRLTRTTSLDNCLFAENLSGMGGGAAISNIGIISSFSNITFLDNLYNCDSGSFLNFISQDGDEGILDGICNGCPSLCSRCSLVNLNNDTPVCSNAPEHTTSPGGTATIEYISIGPGYWRATNTSLNILACYNNEACLGGLTDSSYFCAEGYSGPYCSICTDNYIGDGENTCRACSSSSRAQLTAIIVFSVVAAAIGAFFVLYLLSGTTEFLCGDVAHHVFRHLPFQSIRIIIITWQILTQFNSSLNVSYTYIYETFLDCVAVINFDLGWALSLDCFVPLNFHQRMLLTTLGPNAILSFLGVTYTIAAVRHRDSKTSLKAVRDKHLAMVLLVMFLVYASVSSVTFPMVACDDLDDGKRYLRADYSIECDTANHLSLQIYATFMIMLYPVGIPVFYSWLLFRNRNVLMDEASRGDNPRVQSISDLWKAYKPARFYYEVVECIRRLVITLGVVMLFPKTALQLSIITMITFGFGVLTEVLAPYESPWDTWISRAGYIIDLSSMFYASQLKVDVLDENNRSSRYVDVTLVTANACMVLAAVVQAVGSVRLSRVYELDEPVAELHRHDARNIGEGILVCDKNFGGEIRRDVL